MADHDIGHRFYCKMDLFGLLKLISLIHHFSESTHFISGLVMCVVFEYLIILFMPRSTYMHLHDHFTVYSYTIICV